MKNLTIFTATYNRAYILPKLYESLKNQTNKDFVWLVVDDGSVDDTKILVQSWINEKTIDIEYIYQENGGKSRAHNTGVKNCKTQLFFCVDSDDYITDKTVEKILSRSDELFGNNEAAGIIAYRGKNETEVLGNKFNEKLKTSTLGDLYRAGFVGDTSLIYKSQILKNFLFPEIENEKFVTEDYVYCQIDQKYYMLLEPTVMIVCNYLGDGYTKNALKLNLKNPVGTLMYYNLKVSLAKSFKEKCMYVIRYTGFGKLAKAKQLFKKANNKFLYFLLYPLSMFYYLRKKKAVKVMEKNNG